MTKKKGRLSLPELYDSHILKYVYKTVTNYIVFMTAKLSSILAWSRHFEGCHKSRIVLYLLIGHF